MALFEVLFAGQENEYGEKGLFFYFHQELT